MKLIYSLQLLVYSLGHISSRRKARISRGFTIIETLVAVTILMIAVAGPLVVASKGLNAALYARDQVIASYLAQESMEAIKNQRDNNINIKSEEEWLNDVLNDS
jgi:Tfp pilus assembly protein PilV